MKRRKWVRALLWGVAALIGIGVIMGALFPAGTDPFVPWSTALATKGYNLFYMMEQNEARHKAGEKWCDPQMCSNSVEFINGVLNLIGAEVRSGCCTNVGVAWWNVAIDVPEDYGESFPMLISSNFNPKSLEHLPADNEILPIRRIDPLKDKGIVVVRKCRMSHIIRAKHCTREVVAGNSITRNCRITYLTPEGRMAVNFSCDDGPDANGGPHGH